MKRTFTKIIALLVAVASCISLAACSIPSDETGDGEAKGSPTTFVAIDINPSIELTLDENGIVVTAYGANEDGAVLLYSEETNIIGKAYEEAADHIINLAVELGYVEEGHKINASVSSNDTALAADIKAKLHNKITDAASKLGYTVTLTDEVAHSILRQLNALKESHPNNASIQSLTPEKFKLVLSASENGEITVEAAAELNTEQLINKINNAHSELVGFATDLYKEAKARAEMTYELAMGIALDGIYNTVYLQRIPSIITNPEYRNTFYYGAVYQAYMTIARTFDSLEDIIEFGDEMTNYELSDESVNEIATALSVDASLIPRNENGRVTLKSIISFTEDYLDKYEVSDEVEDRIEDIIDDAEDAAEMIALAQDAYRQDLASLKLQIEAIVSTVNSSAAPLLSFMSAEAKAELDGCIADLNATVEHIGALIDGGLSDEKLDELVDDAEAKAEAMLKKIEADLTDEELQKVDSLKQQATEAIRTLTEEFVSRLDTAEQLAKSELQRIREERLSGKNN